MSGEMESDAILGKYWWPALTLTDCTLATTNIPALAHWTPSELDQTIKYRQPSDGQRDKL